MVPVWSSLKPHAQTKTQCGRAFILVLQVLPRNLRMITHSLQPGLKKQVRVEFTVLAGRTNCDYVLNCIHQFIEAKQYAISGKPVRASIETNPQVVSSRWHATDLCQLLNPGRRSFRLMEEGQEFLDVGACVVCFDWVQQRIPSDSASMRQNTADN